MKNLLQNEKNNFDEILFQGRNKDYGAYVIRAEYSQTITKAMFAGIALFAAVAVTPLLINAFKAPVEVPAERGTEHILKRIEIPQDPPEKEPEIVKPVVPVKPAENTVKIEIPTPVRNAVKETPAPKQSVIKDSKIGHENIVGTTPATTYTPPAEVGPVEVIAPPATVPIEKPKPVDNTPKTTVDVSADFIGGINAFRNKVVSNFDTSAMDGIGELVKTTVMFIVERDGTISDIKASGPNPTFNREAERTIRSVKGKWTPAKLDGENVRSYFKFPISMQFE